MFAVLTGSAGRLVRRGEEVNQIIVDFRKALGTVDHVVLIRKLCLLCLPANIFHWIISFRTGRTLQG